MWTVKEKNKNNASEQLFSVTHAGNAHNRRNLLPPASPVTRKKQEVYLTHHVVTKDM